MILRSATERFGSAGFSTIKDLKNAKLLNNNGLHHGFTFGRQHEQIGFSADTGRVIIGAAGSGKLASDIANALAQHGMTEETATIYVDPKGEIAAISNLNPFIEQYYFNPYGLHNGMPWHIPSHRFNVLEFANPNSPTFFEDMRTIANNLVTKPTGGEGSSLHFWGKATMVATAVLVDGRLNNPHFSLPDFYNVIGDIQSGGGDYFHFHIERMKNSQFNAVRQVAIELESKAQMVPGEFGSIMSTISNSIQCLGSPALQMSLSGQSTISFEDLLKPDKARRLFIMIPAEYIEQCSAVIRCMIAALTIVQQRNPLGRVHFCIDEAGQLGYFEAIERMFSYGRGSKARISVYFQNAGQILKNFGKHGADIIVSNAQSKIILGVASFESAQFVCNNILGKTTYRYISQDKRAEAAFKKTQAFQQALNGGDIANSLLDIAKHSSAMSRPEAVARDLMTPDELMRMPTDMGILDINGLGIKPYRYLKYPYYLNPAIAHQFLPNPFHPPFNSVVLPKKWFGKKVAKVITQEVPESISQLPQYDLGYYSYIEGYNPLSA